VKVVKMSLIKTAVFGASFTLFLFILFSILAVGGMSPFSSELLTAGGFITVLFLGAIEASVNFFE